MKNYLYPFFWLHGEDHACLTEYIEKIEESGMKGLCIESRPHPDFVGEQWWQDVDHILSEVKKRNMKLWILDDSHFPTGYVNGKIKESYPEYLKSYLDMRRYDFQGNGRKIRIDFTLLKGRPWEKPDPSEKILGVYMAKRMSQRSGDGDAVDEETLQDITALLKGRLLTLEKTPEGAYSIFVVFETRKGGEEATADYLNPLVKEATQVLIDTVYEPHFAHYEEEFGKTIEGFFSDEPRFGNKKGTDWQIGADMPLPWRTGLEKELPFEEKYLPLLWTLAGRNKEFQGNVRYQYMDTITRLYKENFTDVLGNWCRAHGVWYLGHTIEDNGAHARLGYGTGHYFRGQEGMDFSGIDTIGGQIVPGMNYHHDAFNTGGSNGEFYHYALAKLASSAAHLDEKKKGRVMCEAFGAYGWNEGLPMMSWIANHLLARGVNYFVPHAFNPKAFPDFDCPPHFYAHGHNPQFRYFKKFSDYINQVSELFQNGHMPANVGVLYPAEQEWAGNYIPIERMTRELTEHQISYEIVTVDFLRKAKIKDGTYEINGYVFDTLVVGNSECFPGDMQEIFERLKAAGVQMLLALTEELPACDSFWKGITLEKLGESLKVLEKSPIVLNESQPDLVLYEYEKDGKCYHMYFNESIARSVDTTLQLRRDVSGTVYDLHLEPYEATIWEWCEAEEGTYTRSIWIQQAPQIEDGKKKPDFPETQWKVSFADSFSYPNFMEEVPCDKLCDISEIPGYEKKAGTVSFEQQIVIKRQEGKRYILEFESVSEIAEVFVNGFSAGQCICAPYRFDLTDALAETENQIRIEVTNSLGTQQRDGISHYLPIESFGICGDVTLYEIEE